MKKIIKRCVPVLIAFVLVFCSVSGAYADMILEYNGYKYSIFNNTSVSLEGWDNRTPELIVPDSINGRYVISVANNALSGNSEITSVDFSQVTRLRRIGMNSFNGCTGITQPIVFPETLSVINSGAFQDCTGLPGVTANDGLTNIPEQCFLRCSSLSNVQLNEGLESIQRIAFAYCTALEYIEIPQSVTFIDTTAFYGDENLTLGVYYDSYAYTYAIENGISYTLIDGVKLGDVDGNGNVDIADVTEIQRYLAELVTLDDKCLAAADTNQDGTVDISDATAIQMKVAEYELPYPIGQYVTKEIVAQENN